MASEGVGLRYFARKQQRGYLLTHTLAERAAYATLCSSEPVCFSVCLGHKCMRCLVQAGVSVFMPDNPVKRLL